jgi:pseudouridylate synthase
LEVLETKGVPVVTLGQENLPAFWSASSNLPSPLRLDSASEIADFQKRREALGIGGGILVANPIPRADEIPALEMKVFINAALQAATQSGVTGKAVTPFLLAKILELTSGRSLAANIALVENNARLAARIAKAMSA